MATPLMSHKKANSISMGIFLICLGILVLTNTWWPGILLALWATVASRQYLEGRIYPALITTVVFVGLFVLALFRFYHEMLLPVLLVIAGIFLIIREYYFRKDTNGEEKSEEIKDDVDLND